MANRTPFIPFSERKIDEAFGADAKTYTMCVVSTEDDKVMIRRPTENSLMLPTIEVANPDTYLEDIHSSPFLKQMLGKSALNEQTHIEILGTFREPSPQFNTYLFGVAVELGAKSTETTCKDSSWNTWENLDEIEQMLESAPRSRVPSILDSYHVLRLYLQNFTELR